MLLFRLLNCRIESRGGGYVGIHHRHEQCNAVVHHRRRKTDNKVTRVSQELERFRSTVTSEGCESFEDVVPLRMPARGNTYTANLGAHQSVRPLRARCGNPARSQSKRPL